MNKEQRKQLEKVLSIIESAKIECEEMAETERGKYDNLSEGLQQSEKGEALDSAASSLDSAASSLDDAYSYIEDAMNG